MSEQLMGFPGLLDMQGDLVGDGDAVAFEGDNFFRVVGENANVFQTQIDQNLRADAAFVLDEALACGRTIELSAGVNMNLRENAGFGGSFNSKTASGVMQVEKNAAIFFGNGRQRARDELVAITGYRTEYISG